MKKRLILLLFVGFVLFMQGCAVYPPYGPSMSYNHYDYGYQPNRNYGWGGGGHHGWGGGHGWGGHHHGWGYGRD